VTAIRQYLGSWPAALLIAAALFARMLVPSGWMPASGFALEFCVEWSGGTSVFEDEAERVLKAALGDGHGDEAQDRASDQPCAFGALASGCAGPVEMAAFVPSAPADPLLAATLIPAPGRGLAAPPPPATGPPLLS